jgi:hypothetical protein
MKVSFLLVRQWSLRVASAALTLLLITPPAFTQTASDFTLVIFPDTQNESQYYPAVYTSQTQWIANNKTSSNIVFVTHVGDIVNTATSTAQWNNADASMDVLDAAEVAYSVGPGNHDVGSGSLYETYFGVSRFSGKSWYGGHYGGDNYNNFSLFNASGMDFILINLQFESATAHLNWADALLKTYSSRRGIVVQHDILNINDSWYNQAPYTALKDNPNLFLMICGHRHTPTDGAAYRAELGDDGHTIHIMLADYQDFPNGGNGYLRILRFSPASNTIYATTYSPYIDSYITTFPDQMTIGVPLPIQMASYSASAVCKNQVEIAWKTASETNNYGFEVYRKRGEISEWAKIGFVQGHGTTLAPQSYLYVDQSLPFGKYRYRIKQLDLDGETEAFPELDVTVGVSRGTLILAQNYPNPFNPSTQIEFVVPLSGFSTVKVYNLLGQEVATVFQGDTEAEKVKAARFDATSLPSGVYFYTLRSAGKVETKRMVLMK